MKTILVISFALLVMSVTSARLLQYDNLRNHQKLNSKCKNWDETKSRCIECYDGCTKWENICVLIVKHCAQWDDEGNCVKCEKGWGSSDGMSINGTCPEQPEQDPILSNPPPVQNNETIDTNCQCHNDNRDCIACYAGFYLDINNICTELPSNCTAATPEGECTACDAGFVVENGTCVAQECDLTLCATFNEDQTQCLSCPLRSYLVDGCCLQVNGYCEEWVQGTGVCTKCYVGYEINKNNDKECIPSPSP